MHALIVEDDRLYRELLQFILEENGFQVTVANNGFEAIKFLTDAMNFQLIISDFNMPELDGKGLVTFILSNNIQFKKLYILSGRLENCELLTDLIRNQENIQFLSKLIPLEILKERYFKL